MKFSDVAKGTRAETETSYKPTGTKEAVKILLRPLSAMEETDVAAAAIKQAKAKGGEPTPGQSIYETAYMANVLAFACLDPDSPAQAREPHFDKGAEQALTLDTDTIAQLFEKQQVWQEECSPNLRTHSVSELFDLAKAVAEEHDPLGGTLAHLSPHTRLKFMRFTCALLVSSQAFKSSISLSGSASGSPDASEPPTKSERRSSVPAGTVTN